MRADKPVFLDTNILLAATETSRSEHSVTLEFLTRARKIGLPLIISSQVLREYLVVATRPREVNGYGLTGDQALQNCRWFQSVTTMAEEGAGTFKILAGLVAQKTLSGKRIHDAHILSTALYERLETLVTWNPRDFESLGSLAILTPAQVLALI